MSDSRTRILREVIETLVSEAPPPVDFENLADTRIVSDPVPSRRSPVVVVVAGFVVIVVMLGGLFVLTNESSPGPDTAGLSSEATIFMMPEFIPDDLVFVLADVTSSGDLTQQFYYQEGLTFSWIGVQEGGKMIVEIVIVDRAEQLDSSGGVEDPMVDFSGYADDLQESDPDLILSEILIRGKPALVVEGLGSTDGQTDGGIRILIREGAAITSHVMAKQLDLNTVIAIAESLTRTSSDAFDSSNWSYQDTSAAASNWANQLGLNQTDALVWSTRLDAICAADRDLLSLAEKYITEDAEYSVRSDGTLPTAGVAKESLEIISLQSCER